MNNPISALLTSLPMAFEHAVHALAELEFTHVDLIALEERPAHHLNALADSGLIVSCMSLGRDLPEGHTLDADSRSVREETVTLIKRQINDSAYLGATHAYLVPGNNDSEHGQLYFTECVGMLADFAESRMIQLCVEHMPNTWLSRADTTLNWIRQELGGKVKLLLDIGHCLISDEDTAQVIANAGDELGYVHFDDNDGVNDLHLPLLTGKLTDESLLQIIRALDEHVYQGTVALELRADGRQSLTNLSEGRELLLRK